jgi:hypothetical protein
MTSIGIVGSEEAKFTPETKATAIGIIRRLAVLHRDVDTLVSGGCHLGGIDIWTEEVARDLGLKMVVHKPKVRKWEGGYKQRNLAIVRDSDEVHCITVAKLPDNYTGMRFPGCYHCERQMDHTSHVKSGGCWTMHKARSQGKPGILHVV